MAPGVAAQGIQVDGPFHGGDGLGNFAERGDLRAVQALHGALAGRESERRFAVGARTGEIQGFEPEQGPCAIGVDELRRELKRFFGRFAGERDSARRPEWSWRWRSR